jgi:hypothetical protein
MLVLAAVGAFGIAFAVGALTKSNSSPQAGASLAPVVSVQAPQASVTALGAAAPVPALQLLPKPAKKTQAASTPSSTTPANNPGGGTSTSSTITPPASSAPPSNPAPSKPAPSNPAPSNPPQNNGGGGVVAGGG